MTKKYNGTFLFPKQISLIKLQNLIQNILEFNYILILNY